MNKESKKAEDKEEEDKEEEEIEDTDVILPEDFALVPVKISDHTLGDLKTMARNASTYAKMIDGGFDVDGNFTNNLIGRIVGLQVYLIHFPGDGQKPETLSNTPNDADIPDGFKRRADVTLQVGSQLVRLRLPHYSATNILPKYVQGLADEGLRPEDGVTSITSERRKIKDRNWNAAKFRWVKTLHPSDKQTVKTQDDIPF
jgi:hypothetical protein